MRYQILIATTITHDTKPAYIIQFDNERYLFGCPEVTQRAFNQSRIKLTKLHNIFLSRSHWDQYGGIPGMLLSLQDIVPGVRTKAVIHSHTSITNFFKTIKGYRKGLDLELEFLNVNKNYAFKDTNLSVSAISILPDPVKDSKRLKSNTDFILNDESVQFVCQGPDDLGKFDIKAAQALNIPRGPMYASLKNGNSITLACGTIVHSSQVCSPTIPGTKWIFIDCPDTSYITNLTINAQLNELKKDPLLRILFHNLGSKVFSSHEYQSWINTFPKSTKHVISSADSTSSPIVFTCLYEFQKSLNQLHPKVFPLAAHDKGNNIIIESDTIHHAVAGDAIEMPDMKYTRNLNIKSNPTKRFIESDLTKEIKSLTAITLGTGASVPLKHRNVSSTLILQPSSLNAYMFDFGEGTLGQLYRHFGFTQGKFVVSKLRALLLSHLHADHHLGFFSLCKQWLSTSTDSDKLYVFGPAGFNDIVTNYFDWERIDGRQKIIVFDHSDITQPLQLESVMIARIGKESTLEFMNALDLVDIQSVSVLHCPDAYAIIMKHKSVGTVAFSGDCRPNTEFAIQANPCTLLIHECTFENDKQIEAIEKRHSTVNEAITISNQMNTKNLILTHFSQRYPRTFTLDDDDVKKIGGMNIAMAFDSMRIGLDDFEVINGLRQPIAAILPEEEIKIL